MTSVTELPLRVALQTWNRVALSEGVQASRRCLLGAAGRSTGLQGGLWLSCRHLRLTSKTPYVPRRFSSF